MVKTNVKVRNGNLIIDGNPIDPFVKFLAFLYSNYDKEYADQVLAEAYHMYKTESEGTARTDEELRNENYDIN